MTSKTKREGKEFVFTEECQLINKRKEKIRKSAYYNPNVITDLAKSP